MLSVNYYEWALNKYPGATSGRVAASPAFMSALHITELIECMVTLHGLLEAPTATNEMFNSKAKAKWFQHFIYMSFNSSTAPHPSAHYR